MKALEKRLGKLEQFVASKTTSQKGAYFERDDGTFTSATSYRLGEILTREQVLQDGGGVIIKNGDVYFLEGEGDNAKRT